MHVYSIATPISRCYGMLIGKDCTGGNVDGQTARWVRGEEEHPGPPSNDVRESGNLRTSKTKILIYMRKRTFCKRDICYCHYEILDYCSDELSSVNTLHQRKLCRSRTSE
jgi:hypothetical protein